MIWYKWSLIPDFVKHYVLTNPTLTFRLSVLVYSIEWFLLNTLLETKTVGIRCDINLPHFVQFDQYSSKDNDTPDICHPFQLVVTEIGVNDQSKPPGANCFWTHCVLTWFHPDLETHSGLVLGFGYWFFSGICLGLTVTTSPGFLSPVGGIVYITCVTTRKLTNQFQWQTN